MAATAASRTYSVHYAAVLIWRVHANHAGAFAPNWDWLAANMQAERQGRVYPYLVATSQITGTSWWWLPSNAKLLASCQKRTSGLCVFSDNRAQPGYFGAFLLPSGFHVGW